MEKVLLSWINNNDEKLKKLGIKIDELLNDDEKYLEPCTRVDLLSEKKISRITVFHSGRTYMEILDIETTKTEFIFDELLNSREQIENFLSENIQKVV